MENTGLLIIPFLIFIVYLLFLILSIYTWAIYKNCKVKEHKKLKVSIIIAARNEEDNIPNLVKSLKQISYHFSLLEIIIVNDQSSDNTLTVIYNELTNSNLNYYILSSAGPSSTPKKTALNLGIKSCTGDIILFTDADCTVKPGWVQSMVNCFQDDSIDLSFGPIRYSPCNTLEKLLSIELAALQGSSVASLFLNVPSMCNGANMAVRKNTFFHVNGFNSTSEIASGDDELLLHKIFKNNPDSVTFIKDSEAIVTTSAASNIRQLFNQRKRWAGKWEKYIFKRTKLFALFIFSFHLIWIVTLIYSILNPGIRYYVLSFIVLKAISEYVFIYRVMNFLGKKLNLGSFVILQILYSVYIVFFGLVSRNKNYQWKNRNLK